MQYISSPVELETTRKTMILVNTLDGFAWAINGKILSLQKIDSTAMVARILDSSNLIVSSLR